MQTYSIPFSNAARRRDDRFKTAVKFRL
jgi:hypothetical protein